MKPALIVGILLIVGGIASLITGGFSFSHQKKDVDAGPIQISHESTQHVPIAPVISGIAIIAGLGLVAVGAKSR